MTRNPHENANARSFAKLISRARSGAIVAVLVAGCGGGSEVLLVPFFTFGFAFNGTLAGANHDVFLNLNPNAPTTATGNFEAFSTLRIDTDSRDVSGSYSGCTLTLTVGPSTGGTASTLIAASYSGNFNGANTIVLTPSSGTLPSLILTRAGGQTDPRAQTC
ncbi:hypothetical protein G8A07_16625 [Roseateles sp. DAIF2]|uniref:hypothetical protein n=1 Tax=Roseateles sp. DAIF2 TaxID=2714952 RepID=UPI0018A29322|nr:hypothetical protein [Roseateles sp. DAIF2]QPF74382.1 hypothetical protein G8A07_16625 [Roseateles sp. DAIF2]